MNLCLQFCFKLDYANVDFDYSPIGRITLHMSPLYGYGECHDSGGVSVCAAWPCSGLHLPKYSERLLWVILVKIKLTDFKYIH